VHQASRAALSLANVNQWTPQLMEAIVIKGSRRRSESMGQQWSPLPVVMLCVNPVWSSWDSDCYPCDDVSRLAALLHAASVGEDMGTKCRRMGARSRRGLGRLSLIIGHHFPGMSKFRNAMLDTDDAMRQSGLSKFISERAILLSFEALE